MVNLLTNDQEMVRTTIHLPKKLMKRSQQLVKGGKVRSRNALIIAALEQFLDEWERKEIDAQFAVMAEDTAYQSLSLGIENEFAESDWEALQAGEAVHQCSEGSCTTRASTRQRGRNRPERARS